MLQAKAQNFEDKVVSIKLMVAGNSIMEILGLFLSKTDYNTFFVANPQALTPQMVPGQTEPQIAMINLMLSGDNKIVEFNRSNIIAICLAHPAAEQEYRRITSDILTPPNPKIIT